MQKELAVQSSNIIPNLTNPIAWQTNDYVNDVDFATDNAVLNEFDKSKMLVIYRSTMLPS